MDVNYVFPMFITTRMSIGLFFFFQAEDGIRDSSVTGVQTCALPISAVCVCGIVNFRTFFQKTEPWMAAISKSEYGDPDDGDLLDRLSPIHRMDRVRTPTLVLHGANDTNCPVVEAEQMVDEIGRRGVPVELVLFPDEGHGFLKTANRVRAAVETVRWFERHLG